jgi:putative Holliday junction resolvase
MRVLGLDVGQKTIGVAVSDALGLAAHPERTLQRQGTQKDAEQVADLVAEYGASAVVFGLPLELSGKEGPRAARVRVFVDALRERLGDTPVYEWDERFSTAAVERVLIDADLTRRRRKQVIDKQAAAFILQGWLDANRSDE